VPEPSPERTPAGSQTLARGLRALLTVVESGDGMTVQELAGELGVHRTIAYRLLQTLASFGFVTVGRDGAYRGGFRLATLANAYLPALRETALPVMREMANDIGCTVSLFVAERGEAVAVALVEPAAVNLARERGYAVSHGEIESGAFAVAAAIPHFQPRVCLNLISLREDQARAAEKRIVDAAERVGRALGAP
jgi:DNA-binding IclR family transcriptional regulator